MTPQQSGFLTLIKSAITNTEYSVPDGFDVGKAFLDAKTHGIVSMIYYGAVNCGLDKEYEVVKKAVRDVYMDIAVSEMQSAEIKRLTDSLENAKIDHMPLKGTRMRGLYPKPEMRRMGDADILIKEEQYDKISALMETLSYSRGYTSDHEFAWDKQALHVELHKRLIPSYNKDYYAYFGDGWKLAKIKNENSCRYSMTDEDEMIYLFTHFAKHYRDAGIGVRHLVDLWVYRINHPNLDEKYICEELKKLQLYEFYKNILTTLAVWFEDREGDEKTDFITEVIFTSGEYGKSEAGISSAILKDMKDGSGKFGVKLKRIKSAVFVGYEQMKEIYPILKRVPLLLPIMWGRHLVRRLVEKKNPLDSVKKRLDVDTDKAREYQKTLNYVGLDFNFTS